MSDAPLREQLAALDACAVSDALDQLGHRGAILGLRPLTSNARLSGRVSTVQIVPRTDDEPRPHLGATAIEQAEPGTVILIANGGRMDVSAWGGILTRAALANGVEGVVVDGVCRDVDEARELGFPVFARGAVPVTARGRIVEESTGTPVTIGEIRVEAGDYLIADGSGIVIVPAHLIGQVLEIAGRIVAKEAAMARAVQDGASITEVMHDRQFDG